MAYEIYINGEPTEVSAEQYVFTALDEGWTIDREFVRAFLELDAAAIEKLKILVQEKSCS